MHVPAPLQPNHHHPRVATRMREVEVHPRPPQTSFHSHLTHILQEYDKENIPPATITAVRPYLDKPEFNPETVKKASKAAYGLCCWVRAMEAYDR